MKLLAGLLLMAAGLMVFRMIDRHPRLAEPGLQGTMNEEARGRRTVPVIVELFTSEGCSSCPPADEVLMKLDASQPVPGAQIIALGEHVDYWNQLGWNDPYSSSEFSKRQGAYADYFGLTSVYTPQMIVDGREEFTGSNGRKAQEIIAEAARSPKGAIELQLSAANLAVPKLSVKMRDLARVASGDTANVLLAVTETDLRSEVSRGENAGRSLRHTAVVRQMSSLGQMDAGANAFEAERPLTLARDWKRENLRVVVFVQENASRRVLAAAMIGLSGN
jgi:hypothetical protein